MKAPGDLPLKVSHTGDVLFTVISWAVFESDTSHPLCCFELLSKHDAQTTYRLTMSLHLYKVNIIYFKKNLFMHEFFMHVQVLIFPFVCWLRGGSGQASSKNEWV